jgi:hypothetical protein
LRRAVIRSGLEALYFSGAHRPLGGLWGGVGAILTLHHVRPARDEAFQPNRFLEVTPEFLDHALDELRRQGIELISLDEMHRRIGAADFKRRFVCLTFDDGYRDNLEWAYPILKRHNAPFAIYVSTSFPDRCGDLWWLTLEVVIAASDHVEMALDDGLRRLPCRTTAESMQPSTRFIRPCALSPARNGCARSLHKSRPAPESTRPPIAPPIACTGTSFRSLPRIPSSPSARTR